MMHSHAIPTAIERYDTLPVLQPSTPPIRLPSSQLDIAGATDPGRVRQKNEDQFLIADLHRSVSVRDSSIHHAPGQASAMCPQGVLLAVADGIGGHAGGQLASAVAIDALLQYATWLMPWLGGTTPGRRALTSELPRAVAACQHRVREMARYTGATQRPPGTTLTAALILGSSLYIVHAGDSRCYLLRDGEPWQLTTDDTVGAELARQSDTSWAERWSHVLSNAITGGDKDATAQVRQVELAAGDVVVLCSDGLTRHVPDDVIAETVTTSPTASAASTALITRANEEGGQDNITVVVAAVEHERSP